jgi:glycosyltransferase involved in cell wall biosynthesis
VASPAPLHIAVDALGTPTGGGVTFTRSVLREMARQRPETRFTLYYSSEAVGAGEHPDNVALTHLPHCGGLFRRWIWEQTSLPRAVSRNGADLLLCMNGFASFPCRIPQIAIWQNAHVVNRVDLHLPRKTALLFWFQRQLHRMSVVKARRNVYLTRHFADMAAELWPVGRVERSVVHSGIDAHRVAKRSPAEGRAPAHRAVSVGHTYVQKNYEALIDAMAIYRERYPDDLELWIAGAVWDVPYHASLLARIEAAGVGDRIRMLGPLDEAEVAELYAGAKLYVTTSILESFGLTTLEAMANELPVLAPRASCFPEVCGDAALYCDPHDPEDVAAQLHRLATDDALRERLRELGRERVQHFSWQLCAAELFGEIDAALGRA